MHLQKVFLFKYYLYDRPMEFITYKVQADSTIKFTATWQPTAVDGLVATIHENSANASGKWTTGDRWSSEQGNTDQRLSGDGNWVNRNTFGHVRSATSDDYKNHAFFELQARDLMIWQTPVDTPVQNYNTSYLKYRTTNGFLSRYGGNLQKLFSQYILLRLKLSRSFW